MARNEPSCVPLGSQELLPTGGAGDLHYLGLFVIPICRNDCHYMSDIFFAEIASISSSLLMFIICHRRDSMHLDLIVTRSHLRVRTVHVTEGIDCLQSSDGGACLPKPN